MGALRVVSAEGLIGFKLQAYVNDSTRLRDLDDIRALLRANRAHIDMRRWRDTLYCSTVRYCCVKSSPTSIAERRPPQDVLVDGLGVPVLEPPRLPDPFAAWIDLMEAVEALCPRRPDRAPSRGSDYRL